MKVFRVCNTKSGDFLCIVLSKNPPDWLWLPEKELLRDTKKYGVITIEKSELKKMARKYRPRRSLLRVLCGFLKETGHCTLSLASDEVHLAEMPAETEPEHGNIAGIGHFLPDGTTALFWKQ